MCSTEELLMGEPQWQIRVKQERYDLEYALQRLNLFINSTEYKTIPELDQELLFEQKITMEALYNILGKRICNFSL